ncbi:squalene/phytoene synthase family protein [Jannaschia ovalis]|uniref:Squalene/phytoene synthase family protein n=1 Tax=Jannaschia ovalis TaxID=3038773 RepID=A0ABY8LB22_9RHOB|nr:squalene/phytoene synthase family protein [Jannaschia sp. GRR-S6-38]WGH78534.1 squalene/phytoene synthase family protein [Jannaschia sp. GRR-S6-38]
MTETAPGSSDDIAACADLVRRGDPARFRAVMAAPVRLRAMLFPLYAFNIEVARAPWVTSEPMIAQMRLQWWREALDEIAAGGKVRRHEVVTPLAAVVDRRAAQDLDDMIVARHDDIEGLRIADPADLTRYLDRTAGTLLWSAARLAGAEDAAAVRDGGLAHGIASWLLAAPDLAKRGRAPLPPGPPEDRVRDLAEAGLAALARFREARPPKAARGVFLVLSDVGPILRAFRDRPGDQPDLSDAGSRWRLMRAAVTGRV